MVRWWYQSSCCLILTSSIRIQCFNKEGTYRSNGRAVELLQSLPVFRNVSWRRLREFTPLSKHEVFFCDSYAMMSSVHDAAWHVARWSWCSSSLLVRLVRRKQAWNRCSTYWPYHLNLCHASMYDISEPRPCIVSRWNGNTLRGTRAQNPHQGVQPSSCSEVPQFHRPTVKVLPMS